MSESLSEAIENMFNNLTARVKDLEQGLLLAILQLEKMEGPIVLINGLKAKLKDKS